MQRKFDDQTRLLTTVAGHKKNPAANIQNQPDDIMQRMQIDAARGDRVMRQMNRSSFMGLGENPPNLFSEQDPTMAKRVTIADDFNPAHGGGVFMDKNQSYLNDESVPSAIYQLIDTYRIRARSSHPGD